MDNINENNKIVIGRVINKHATEAVWNEYPDFIPNIAETIVYDVDENYKYPRIKMGDGLTSVSKLPFIGNKLQINDNKPGHACRWFNTHAVEVANINPILDEGMVGYIILDE